MATIWWGSASQERERRRAREKYERRHRSFRRLAINFPCPLAPPVSALSLVVLSREDDDKEVCTSLGMGQKRKRGRGF